MNAIYVHMEGLNQTSHLPSPVHMKGQDCALFEISGSVYPYVDGALYLCADFVDDSFMKERMAPILRCLHFTPDDFTGGATIHSSYRQNLWVPCIRSPIKEFRLYIINEQATSPPFLRCNIRCTLAFRRSLD